MTSKQTRTVGLAARLLRDTYLAQGDSRDIAKTKTLKAFNGHLAGTPGRRKRLRAMGGLKCVDSVGVVALALKKIGLAKPDQWTQEVIIEAARKALADGSATSGEPNPEVTQ